MGKVAPFTSSPSTHGVPLSNPLYLPINCPLSHEVVKLITLFSLEKYIKLKGEAGRRMLFPIFFFNSHMVFMAIIIIIIIEPILTRIPSETEEGGYACTCHLSICPWWKEIQERGEKQCPLYSFKNLNVSIGLDSPSLGVFKQRLYGHLSWML